LKAFAKIKGYIERAKDSPDVKILAGGNCDDRLVDCVQWYGTTIDIL